MTNFGEARSTKLRKSIVTSIIGKFSSVGLQVVSLPIAAVALGNERFALYAMMTSILAWLNLSNVGIGPALTIRFSSAISQNKKFDAINVYITAASITMIISISLAVVAGLAIFGTPAASHVFRNYANNSFDILTSLAVVVGIFLLMTNLSVVESAQIALQEGYKLNTAIGLGMLFAALFVFIAAKTTPMVVTILLAANLPTILARVWNAIRFIKINAFLRHRFRLPDRGIASSLLKDGALFSFSGSVNNFLSHFFPIIIIGKLCEPDYSAAYSALIAALIIFSSFFSITTVPLLGALPEARIRNDFRWIRKVYLGVLRSNIAFSVITAAGLWFFGSELFSIWYQGKINPSLTILKYSGLYFVLLSLEVTNFSFLSSLGYIRISSIFLAIKTILFVGLFLFFSNPTMLQLPFALLILTNFVFSAIPLTVICWRSMRA